MQRPPRRPNRGGDHGTGLQFPTLPFNYDIDDWLKHSELIVHTPNKSMASLADDSSVDENVSSVGGSTWDMVDEASAASEDEADRQTIPRNPNSDSIENLHLDHRSFSGASHSRGSPGADAKDRSWRFEEIQRPDLDNENDTPTASSYQGSDEASTSMDTPSPGGLRLDEIVSSDPSGLKHVRAKVKDFTLPHETSPNDGGVIYQTGSVAMGTSERALVASETLKLLYVGPREMKALITQKIGCAVAANPRRLSLKDGLDSSRVTVVPVSALFDDSNPEVVMIESGGFDMNIEECVNAFHTQNENSDEVTVELDSQRNLKSIFDFESCRYHLSDPELAPDLAVFYQPAGQSIYDDLTSYWTETLLTQHNIPFYSVSPDGDWIDPSPGPGIVANDMIPHRTLDYLLDGDVQTPIHLPINLSSFLALDASQLHHNIVALKEEAAKQKSEKEKAAKQSTAKTTPYWLRAVQKKWQSVPAPLLLKFVLPSFTVVIMLVAILLARYFAVSQHSAPSAELTSSTYFQLAQQTVVTPLTKPSSSGTPMQVPQSLKAQLSAKSLSVREARIKQTDDGNKSKPSRVTAAQVIGGSHILIRPAVPTKAAQMSFQARRDNKVIPTTLQSFDGEYYVLEIPAADAFGLMEIHIRSTGRPRFEETIEVDLGSAWTKPKHWQELAQSLSEWTMQEVLRLSEQMQESIATNTVLEAVQNQTMIQQLQDHAAALLNEADRLSKWSSSTLTRQHKAGRKQMRELKKLARKLRRSGIKRSAKFAERYAKMMQRVESASEQVKKSWAAGSSELQLKTVRRAQKKLLHAWWKIRGRPELH